MEGLLTTEAALHSVHALAERDPYTVGVEKLGVEVGRPLAVEAPEVGEEELCRASSRQSGEG